MSADDRGIRWFMPAELQTQLLTPTGLPLADWLRDGTAVAVKTAPHRIIFRVQLPGLDFYLKEYRAAGLRNRAREWLRPVKAKREYHTADLLLSRGLPTHKALAWGVAGPALAPEASFLITETLADTRPLGEFLEAEFPTLPAPRQIQLRQRLATALGEFLAAMHSAGVVHHDPHPGNLLIRLAADDRPELFLIDVHAVRVGSPCSWRTRRQNLVLFNRWFILRTQRSDRLRFWRAYHSVRQLPLPDHPDATPQAMERDTERSNQVFWRARDRRCRASNRYFTRVKLDAVTGFAVRDLDPVALFRLLADPDAPFDQPGALFLKDSPSSTVTEMSLPVGDTTLAVIYKRFKVTHSAEGWKNLARLSPALRSWVMGHGMLQRQLPTARPLAVFHRRRRGLPAEGYLVTVKIPNAVDLHELAGEIERLTDPARTARIRSVVDELARLVRTLHERKLSHRDVKAANILIQTLDAAQCDSAEPGTRNPEPFYFIDLVGVRVERRLPRRMRVKNLARLHASFHDHPLVTRTEKLRFLRTYLQWYLRGKERWKRWWKEVAEATVAKVARNTQSGRVLR